MKTNNLTRCVAYRGITMNISCTILKTKKKSKNIYKVIEVKSIVKWALVTDSGDWWVLEHSLVYKHSTLEKHVTAPPQHPQLSLASFFWPRNVTLTYLGWVQVLAAVTGRTKIEILSYKSNSILWAPNRFTVMTPLKN